VVEALMLRRFIERLGARAIDLAGAGAALLGVLGATLRGSLRGQRPKGEVVGQMHVIGNKSLLFVAVTMGFVGMVMVYQSCLQLNRITGDLSQIGPEYLKLLIQDFGPSITALMLATRVGAGIAAEVGSMVVTEQIDALRMSGVTAVDYLIVPRFLAALVMTGVLSVFGVMVAYAAGGLTAWASFDVNPRVFFDISRVGWFDLTIGGTKALLCGTAIPVISGFCGLRARGSSAGVGAATTAAVIGSSLAVIVIAFVISGIGLFLIKAGIA
jgi:phospholipid/cholesterol/gamma-HCH transport system permease protein